MSIAAKLAAILEAVGAADIEALRPADRRRLADRCRQVADLADRSPAPAAGVLADLKDGRGRS
jgi:hypothetical protein